MHRDEEPPQPDRQPDPDQALLDVVVLPAHPVMLQVENLAIPRVRTELPGPDAEQHRVLQPRAAPEVLIVDQVVLELVKDRERDRHGGDDEPPGENPAEVARSDGGHDDQAGDEDREPEPVLMPEPRMSRAEAALRAA